MKSKFKKYVLTVLMVILTTCVFGTKFYSDGSVLPKITKISAAEGISDFSELESAVTAGGTVVIGGDIIFERVITISGGQNVIIKSADENDIKTLIIISTTAFRHFNVTNGNLILENIVLDGGYSSQNTSNRGGGISVSGASNKLTINEGAVIQNCCYSADNVGGGIHIADGSLIMNGGEIRDNTVSQTASSFGGGVRINNGTFEMNDGVISKNIVKATGNYARGGGVYCSGGGIFTMNGGIIKENQITSGRSIGGGGVGIYDSQFIMNDGEIKNNSTLSDSYGGGGVYVAGAGVFTMYNGKVDYNSSYQGGGIYIGDTGKFIMENGSISGNTSFAGGGIYDYGSGITINGGEIVGNTASSNGGGVYTIRKSIMNGGEIKNNNCTQYGGGIYSYTFIFNGGSITENTAGMGGGGVYSQTLFEMTNGKISNNKASGVTAAGGGILIEFGKLIMTGGEISGNTCVLNSTQNYAFGGGGVYLSGSSSNKAIFEMSGGKISGNSVYRFGNFQSQGGGVGSTGVNHSFTMTGGEISGNTASGDFGAAGGGVFVAYFEMTAGIITGNKVISSSKAYGGGIYITLSIKISGGIISGNSAMGNPAAAGGGIYISESKYGDSNVKIEDQVIFMGNMAQVPYAPPENAETAFPNLQFGRTSIEGHILNNYDISYIADGREITDIIRYKLNGGDGREEFGGTSQYALSVEEAGFIKEGYMFMGWNTQSDGKGTCYMPGEELPSFNIELYAQWEDENSDSITLEDESGNPVNPGDIIGEMVLRVIWDDTKYVLYVTTANGTDRYTESGVWITVTAETDLELIPFYTVIFDSNGGTNIESQKAEFLIIKPEDPVRSGYVFVGWYTDNNDFENQWHFETMTITSNITLYAKWITLYTVTFDSNGGSSVTSQEIIQGNMAQKPYDPAKTNYTFDGWYTDNDTFLNEWDFDDAVTQNMTLYAKWIAVYTVTFETNGGSSIDSQQITEGNTAQEPSEPVKEGYDFRSWYTDNDTFLNEWDFSDIVTQNMTLYAKWEAIKYTVSFEPFNGETIEDQKIESGNKIIKPGDPVRSGYIFMGWVEAGGEEWNFDTMTVTKDMTLYVKWGHEVTFETNCESEINSQIIESGQKVEKPANPDRSGYEFIGWYTDNDTFLNEWEFNDAVTQNMTLYAKWIAVYTVTFDTNGGSSIDSQEITEGNTAQEPSEPVKEGYEFMGWYTDNDTFLNEWDFNDTVTQNMTLYAKWEAIKYTVSFEPYNGETIEDQKIEAGNKIIRLEDPVRSGYIFMGWFEAGGEEWNFDTMTVTKDITLYAKWGHEVIFDTNDESGIDSRIIESGQKVEKPANPDRSGYEFMGWYTDNDTFLNEWDFSEAVTQNMTLYAKWEELYTVSFDSNGGSMVASQNVIKDGKAEEPSEPALEGHTFKGWYTDNSFTTLWDFNNMTVTSNITLYAQWEINTYIVTFDENKITVTAILSEIESGDEVDYGVVITIAWSGNYCLKVNGNTVQQQIAGVAELKVTQDTVLELVALYTVGFDSNGFGIIPSQLIEEGEKVDRPQDPDNTGYHIAGWFTDEALTNEWNFENPVTQNMTLYAKWEINIYVVNFDESLITVTVKGTRINSGNLVEHGTDIVITWDDEKFMVLANGKNVPGQNINYAQFKVLSDVNLALTAALKIPPGIDIIDPENPDKPLDPDRIPQGIAISFGWDDKAFVLYVNEDRYTVSRVTIILNENTVLELVAIYIVTFDVNGGSDIEIYIAENNTYAVKPVDPVKENYIFEGWYTEDGIEWDFENMPVNEHITLYAKWISADDTQNPNPGEGWLKPWMKWLLIIPISLIIIWIIFFKKREEDDEDNKKKKRKR